MKVIVIKIKLQLHEPGTVLRDLSRMIEKYLRRRGVVYECIDAALKNDDRK